VGVERVRLSRSLTASVKIYNPNVCPVTEVGRGHGKKQYDKKWQNTIKHAKGEGGVLPHKNLLVQKKNERVDTIKRYHKLEHHQSTTKTSSNYQIHIFIHYLVIVFSCNIDIIHSCR